MSASASQAAVLGARGTVAPSRARVGSGSTFTRLLTFGALAFYGIVKWSTLLVGHPLPRLLGLLGIAMLLVTGRPILARRSRLLAALATAIAVVAALPVAGVPLEWVWHVRIAVTANAIGEGMSALPQVLVPYSGANQWVDLVMTLGAAVLLFDAALLVSFAPGPIQPLRRAGAALPLVALAAVPTTLVHSFHPYLDGAIMFALLVAFMWGEEIGRRRVGGALGLSALAVVIAMFLAPAVDRHKPWFNYRALAGGLATKVVDGFDWSQGYGPIDWPRVGRVVLEIKAPRPEYWKAQNLDVFNGIGWAQQVIPGRPPAPDASAVRRWSQTIQVTLRDMQTRDVIGAGTSEAPINSPQPLSAGTSTGTWTTEQALRPGDAYQVKVYEPHPNADQLAAAGADYSALPSGYRSVDLAPVGEAPSPYQNYVSEQVANGIQHLKGYQAELIFPAFHSGGAISKIDAPQRLSPTTLLRGSDAVGHHSLADVYRLAQALGAGAATPYQFAQVVETYLSRGFVYSENPPLSPFPLVSFLFSSHRGYCQQFAGAMALLLRMGGVPARVAAGFTPGRKDAATGRWLVTDYDAHAWVEVWFPHYGWVTFDPTPSEDPALSRQPPTPATSGVDIAATGTGLSATKSAHPVNPGRRRVASASGASAHTGSGVSPAVPWVAESFGLVVLVLIGIATRPLRSLEEQVVELERALKRMGRPLPGGATLTWLERRVGISADAAAYVRALRLARFRGADRAPTSKQRRALRRQLRRGLGPFGFVRSIWALPPRWRRPTRPARRSGRLQTRTPGTSGA